MSRRALLLMIGSLCLLILILGWLVHDHPADRSARAGVSPGLLPVAPGGAEVPPDPSRRRAVTPISNGRILLPEAEALARSLNAADGSARQDVETLAALAGLFRKANQGAIPAGGLNEEITEQMLGKNTRNFAVLPPDCPGLNAAGQLVDRWGTPYFLHPLSHEILEIHSAGPDRKFGTADDVEIGEEAGAGIRR